ncbi:nitrous oxidase accessory protein [Rhodothermus profundi]|uniref:Nitrous oxidase accessory protein n=2 Tax=Rhodothermus profundi TaxID=633813 RepID=A0A1M6PQR4_9BACT|nr:nitrous oxidase accessory protein [Rhodothermus profundi]
MLAFLWLSLTAAQAQPATSLQERLAAAAPGDTVRVVGGVHSGPLRITQPVVLLGEQMPVIDGRGQGTVVTIEAPHVVLQGFVIRNSGRSLDQEDAGIAVYADHVTIADNRLEKVLFGIYLRQADSCRILRNIIEGDLTLETARRGDLIRLWYSNDAIIQDNVTRYGRDVVIWFARGIVLRGNTIAFGRYGLHFMYSDQALIERNRMLQNSVGAYLMYSTRLTFRHNLLAYNRHASAIGVGLKDMDEVRVEENAFVDNQIGIFIDNSPRAIEAQIRYRGNVIAYNDIGVQALQEAPRSTFEDNSFMDNYEQVDLVGGGQFSEENGTFWRRNYWSDYRGYDADRDGYGDLPYQAVALFDALTDRTPAFRLFVFSPAVQALELAARAFPVIRPAPKLIDPTPRMHPRLPEGLPAARQQPQPTLALAGLALLLMGMLTVSRVHLRRLD